MQMYLFVAFGMSAQTESHTSSQAHPFPQVCGCILFGNARGQDLEKLVFLGLGSLLVRRRVTDENVNTGLP